MRRSAARRVGLTLTCYAAGAWAVLAGAAWLRRALALPELFGASLRGALVVGLPVALLVAWRYPEIGHHGDPPPGSHET